MKNFLHHLFLPRESNNHRSRLLHHSSLLIVISLLFVGHFFITTVEKNFQGVLGISTNISIDELLAITNDIRREKGLSPLTMSSELGSAATNKASDMFAKNYWAHNAPDGTPPWIFIKGAGYDYIYAGENLARGFDTARDVVNAWMDSPGHRENMLNPNYTEIGFAVSTGTLTGDETALVVEMFGSRTLAGKPTPAVALAVLPSPTPEAGSSGVIIPNPTTQPTSIPTPTVVTPTAIPGSTSNNLSQITAVAARQTSPLINSDKMSRNIAYILLGIFISILLLDMIVVERNNIVRFVGHNIDHIIFLAILLAMVFIVTKGTIL